jgi:AcrR family transcriptional regulator
MKRRVVLDPAVRRTQILDAATSVFARRGYRNATISHVIARAGIARGTFYLYFTSKEQVFLAIVERFYNEVQSALESVPPSPNVPAGGARDLLRVSFRSWLGFFAAHRETAIVILREATSIDQRFEKGLASLRALAHDHFAARIRHLQSIGAARSSVSADLVAHLQLGMFDELLNAYVLKSPGVDLDELAAQLADFEWFGIAPE